MGKLQERLLATSSSARWSRSSQRSTTAYGRTIGHVLIDKRDVNLELLEDGAVWHYEAYDHNKRLREAEASARAGKKGLWRDANPVAPWDWRKTEKERKGK